MVQTTRETILLTARDLFYEKGTVSTSMRDIAAGAGVAPSSLYNHFKTKDDLISAVMENSFQLVDDAVAPFFESGPRCLEMLRQALRAHALQHVHGIKESRVFELQRGNLSAVVRERAIALRDVYEKRFYELADYLQAQGVITEYETHTRMRMVLSAGRDIGNWFRTGGRLSEDEVADLYAELGIGALQNVAGRHFGEFTGESQLSNPK